MKSYITSFTGLFEHRADDSDAPVVTRIEIPLIQRDYAQGRESASVSEIRNSFLEVLHSAVAGENPEPVGLDFVYGDVEDGTFRPLDGQQRLTTLFLLHWYLAFRADRPANEGGWKQFSYATRPSARLFCERIVAFPPPNDPPPNDFVQRPSTWIKDQAWYLHVWQHDPTIQAMLVMLDAIHSKFSDVDADTAWARLVNSDAPAISFHLLPINDMGSEENLYIKMNSRGKPLTPFENFKARFEKTIAASDRAAEFSHKVDGAWADILWNFRGDDDIVDDEFGRYFEFLTSICELREGAIRAGRLETRAEQIFGTTNPRMAEHLDFLFSAFDTWVAADVHSAFDSIFTIAAQIAGRDSLEKVVLFGTDASTNLFNACCRTYGNTRLFSLAQTLLLYAVLVHRIKETKDFPRRVRIVRNLIESSINEVRQQNMPKLIEEVESIITDGALDDVLTFNQNQVDDERRKQEFLETNPEMVSTLRHLEDHPLLRGSLVAFDLDAATLEVRAETFARVFADPDHWATLTGTLLATGEYQRERNSRSFQFGTGSKENESPWRELFTGASRRRLETTRQVLGNLLDEVAASELPVGERLDGIRANWLLEQGSVQQFDWRYYFVKYDSMREGGSGIYFGRDGTLGYSVCMLNRTQLNSWYRDPYLLAVWRESGVGDAVADPWFTGYEWDPRWLRLEHSGTRLRCIDSGFELIAPPGDENTVAFEAAASTLGVSVEHRVIIPQTEREGRFVDTCDRVQVGSELLRALIDAGL